MFELRSHWQTEGRVYTPASSSEKNIPLHLNIYHLISYLKIATKSVMNMAL